MVEQSKKLYQKQQWASEPFLARRKHKLSMSTSLAECTRKIYKKYRFSSFINIKVLGGGSDYRINSHTAKRGFLMTCLIILFIDISNLGIIGIFSLVDFCFFLLCLSQTCFSTQDNLKIIIKRLVIALFWCWRFGLVLLSYRSRAFRFVVL
jgi:hypothetical protein